MLSKQDFIEQYEDYTDEQLYHIYSNSVNYSPEAQEAVMIVIEKKGGLDKLKHRVANRGEVVAEINRIGNEAAKMLQNDIDPDFVRSMITSGILEQEETKTIIENAIAAAEKTKADKNITPRTIIGSIFGLILATLIGSIACGLALKQLTGRIPLVILVLLLVGLALLCYAIIRAFTRQSRQNVVVLLSTVIAVVLSILIGSVVADLFL